MGWAVFRDKEQVSKTHPHRDVAVIEAVEMGLVNTARHGTMRWLDEGYNIRRVEPGEGDVLSGVHDALLDLKVELMRAVGGVDQPLVSLGLNPDARAFIFRNADFSQLEVLPAEGHHPKYLGVRLKSE